MHSREMMMTGLRGSGFLLVFLVATLGSVWGQTFPARPKPTNDVSAILPETHFPELQAVLTQLDAEAPELLIRRAEIAESEALEGVALSRKWVRVRGNAGGALRNAWREDDRGHEIEILPVAELEATQPLYRWGALDAARDQAKLRTALAERRYTEVYRLLLIRVREEYLNLVALNSQMALADAKLKREQQRLSEVRDAFAGGTATEETLNEAQLDAEEAALMKEEVSLIKNEAVARFRLLTNWQGPLDLTGHLVDRPAPLPPHLAEVMTRQAPQPAEVTAKRMEIEIEEQEEIIIEAQTLPQVDLVGAFYYDEIESADREDVGQFVLDTGLVVTWNIFDGWQTKYELIASKARQRKLEREMEQIEAENLVELQRLKDQRSLLEQRLRVAEQRVDLRQRVLSQRQQEARVDVTPGEVENARLALVEARVRREETAFEIVLNATRLASLYGLDPYLNR